MYPCLGYPTWGLGFRVSYTLNPTLGLQDLKPGRIKNISNPEARPILVCVIDRASEQLLSSYAGEWSSRLMNRFLQFPQRPQQHVRILHSGSKAQDFEGIPEAMVCRILMFMFSLWGPRDDVTNLPGYEVAGKPSGMKYPECFSWASSQSHPGDPVANFVYKSNYSAF